MKHGNQDSWEDFAKQSNVAGVFVIRDASVKVALWLMGMARFKKQSDEQYMRLIIDWIKTAHSGQGKILCMTCEHDFNGQPFDQMPHTFVFARPYRLEDPKFEANCGVIGLGVCRNCDHRSDSEIATTALRLFGGDDPVPVPQAEGHG